MGQGYKFSCKNCGAEYVIDTGVGVKYPEIYADLKSRVAEGRYGEEWKETLAQNKYYAIDAERYLYRCENCNFWECGPDMSIYEPIDVEELLDDKYGNKTVREWGYLPYALGRTLRKQFKLLKKRVHTCERCGQEMHRISQRNVSRVIPICLECGSKLEKEPGSILWS